MAKINHLVLQFEEGADYTKAKRACEQLNKLIDALNKKEVPEEAVASFNDEIEAIGASKDTPKILNKRIQDQKNKMLRFVTKELKLVPKNYYMILGMSLGMSALGVTFGIVISLMLDNFAFLGVGIGTGLAIGVGIGAALDNKAASENRQLDIAK